ncbi:RNA polymerase sigma factor [Ruminococcus flavefaciens]|uniref:RNA polymerase sigma factor n=1 Tax=Ruminococcus flavefaciens TaxID=1265 RepID=UPI0026EFED1F|nr:sigma-70 family RNA polymerase sigma factor [Ruminococcus flavefaciens]MDD7515326.1 sigma-70 family RNA polymerase sigma factor [Ruminococcus flavefaciens]MDY5692601.1 sigma-70 family RNA polymerase sigma factor [Ruminococcus flavefaciens]
MNNDSTALHAFKKYGNTVLRAAFAFCGSYAESEDIVQDVFLSLHTSPQSFNDDEHMKAWLLRVTINKCKNLKRSFRFSRTCSLDELEQSEAIEETKTDGRELRNQIASLPKKYAEVIFLHYYEGYSIKEIAQITEKNENTVGSLLRRGREKLKAELEKEDGSCRETIIKTL